MVTGFFYRTALGNKLLRNVQSQVTGNCPDFLQLWRTKADNTAINRPSCRSRCFYARLCYAPNLPPGYSISEGRLAYNEEWDETAEMQSDLEVEDSDL